MEIKITKDLTKKKYTSVYTIKIFNLPKSDWK